MITCLGNVKSTWLGCLGNRTVKVYMHKGNEQSPATDPVIAYDTTRSTAEGEWEIPAGAPGGDFYAVAEASSMDKDTTLVCKRVESAVFSF